MGSKEFEEIESFCGGAQTTGDFVEREGVGGVSGGEEELSKLIVVVGPIDFVGLKEIQYLGCECGVGKWWWWFRWWWVGGGGGEMAEEERWVSGGGVGF